MPTPARRYSAILTCHDRIDYLLEAVTSVKRQTLPAFETIVVLDGSPDGSSDRILSDHPDVHVIVQPTNLGKSIAANVGAYAANGEWLCFLDDDDLWHPDKLQGVDDFLDAHPECRALRHHFWYFSSAEHCESSPAKIDLHASSLEECLAAARHSPGPATDFSYLDILGRSFELMLERNRGAFSETVLSRELYFQVGGHPPTHATAGDWILFLNVARLAEWYTLAEPLAFQRLHSRQATVNNMGLFILSAKVGAWLTGRAFPSHLDVESTVAQLARYGREYRWEVRQFLWAALRSRDMHQAALIGALGTALLPRWRDRFYVLVPPRKQISRNRGRDMPQHSRSS